MASSLFPVPVDLHDLIPPIRLRNVSTLEGSHEKSTRRRTPLLGAREKQSRVNRERPLVERANPSSAAAGTRKSGVFPS